MKDKIKVLIVDDSALVRQTFKEILNDVDDIEIIGLANDPLKAADLLAKGLVPDVIISDIEMPKMDGLTFLKKIMTQYPIPTIICSKLVEQNSDVGLKAIEAGAIEVISKPVIGTKQYLYEIKTKVVNAIRAAAKADLKIMNKIKDIIKTSPKLTADAVVQKIDIRKIPATKNKIIAIGASTGGTEAIEYLLKNFPDNLPGIVIVQHMPAFFTKSFAKRLNRNSNIAVKEAENGDKVKPGTALIAQGGKHLLVKRIGDEYIVEIKDGPLVKRHKPSVDVLFRTVAQNAGQNAIGILLTGMGDDGAYGLKEMKDKGAFTIAQDEETSVVFGMPKEAIKLGAVDKILPLGKIVEEVINYIYTKWNK